MYHCRQFGKGLLGNLSLFLVLLEHALEGIASIALVDGHTDAVSLQTLVHGVKTLLADRHVDRCVLIEQSALEKLLMADLRIQSQVLHHIFRQQFGLQYLLLVL